MVQKRRYPVGIQTFSEIINKGYVYADKTGLVYELVDNNKYVFLSRPRRFGKSLLSSTLHSYLAGEKELFKGLAMEGLEQEWIQYPVLHFDLSTLKNSEIETIREKLTDKLKEYEPIYGKSDKLTPGSCLEDLIQRAYTQTGRQVAIIIDEYDAPMLDTLHKEEQLEQVRTLMQEFFAPLKACDRYLKFVFITGITKFSQLSIFSVINNLTNITMQSEYAAICGITEEELETTFGPDIEMLARVYECSPEEMKEKLKEYYDGYHFTDSLEDIYNPFSLLKAFLQKRITSYWFESGTPTYLIHQMKRFRTNPTTLDEIEALASDFDRPTEAMTNALPLLYQSGYLTIKGYDRQWDKFYLGIPNKEVRVGLMENLLPAYSPTDSFTNSGFVMQFCEALSKNDLDGALTALRAYLAHIPYPEGGKEVIDDLSRNEYYYETIFYLVFSLMNRHIRTQVKSCRGRADIVMYTSAAIYVFELKINRPASEALAQINAKDYALPYTADSRQVVKCGISFSTKTRTIEEWEIEPTPSDSSESRT